MDKNTGIHRQCSLWLLALLPILLTGCAVMKPPQLPKKPVYDYSKMDGLTRQVHKKVETFLMTCKKQKYPVATALQTRIDSVIVEKKAQKITIYLSKPFSFIPFREQNVDLIYTVLKKELGRKFRHYQVTVSTLNQPIEQLIPNLFRSDSSRMDIARMPIALYERPEPIVRNRSKILAPVDGLWQRNIALWHSHGWFYNFSVRRWEWQRPRLFGTVEDLLASSFTIPYLVPMLENAGANVFIPRERDLQTNMVILDNDSLPPLDFPPSYLELRNDTLHSWQTGIGTGFGFQPPPYPANFNLFLQGSHRVTRSDSIASARAQWLPGIPEDGSYAVYVSYCATPENVTDAHYRVYHLGGQTDLAVNQQIGGSTWIYLGTFHFRAGYHPEQGKVELSNQSAVSGRLVSADAVRFGGGMGSIVRAGQTSGRPRYQEASRYYLQFAGMPDTLVYNLSENKDDYKDDYNCRPEYVNFLTGAPFGPNKNRNIAGLGVPIDLSLAMHTDAGITRNDTTIGTLVIYSVQDFDTNFVFPDGVSRLANRDLADIVQSQVVADLRARYDPAWRRRPLMESQYWEAVRPNVPSLMLELLSHQNFLDVRFALDPRFRFDAARAIYKGILRFLAFQNQKTYRVQPLPVSHFQALFSADAQVTLKWQPVSDPLEPTATPSAYRVYTRIENGAFDNGQIVTDTRVIFFNLEPGRIYSYKVTAVNRGGESFASEILSVCWLDGKTEPVLIINGFDRICGPAWISQPGFIGFLSFLDNGVADQRMFNFTGEQFDFHPGSTFRLNDSPGHGASFADYETRIIAGNTFDYPFVHGQSIRACGYAFVSASDEAVMDRQLDISRYKTVDLILGEEKATSWPVAYGDSLWGKQFQAFPEKLQQQIRLFCDVGGHLFISGAYVGSDLCANRSQEHPDVIFAQKVLKFNWITDHAARTGRVYSVADNLFKTDEPIVFNTNLSENMYAVEAPDAIQNVIDSSIIMRYVENNFGAATAFKKDYRVVVFGFPFESILTAEMRHQTMQAIFNFFKK